MRGIKIILNLILSFHIEFALKILCFFQTENGRTFRFSNVEFPNNTIFFSPFSECFIIRREYIRRDFPAWFQYTFNAKRCECVFKRASLPTQRTPMLTTPSTCLHFQAMLIVNFSQTHKFLLMCCLMEI